MKEHSTPKLSTPEKERLPDQSGDLKLTPVHGKKSEEVDSLPSPTPGAFKCDECNTQFPDSHKLKFHNFWRHDGKQPAPLFDSK